MAQCRAPVETSETKLDVIRKILIGSMLGVALPAWSASCGSALPEKNRQIVRGDDLEMAFTATPWPLPVGQHFRLDMAVCNAPGAGTPTAIRVDAEMPVHKHGMNYLVRVTPSGKGGLYTAEGLMFHMPGRWRIIFDVDVNGHSHRLTKDVDVE